MSGATAQVLTLTAGNRLQRLLPQPGRRCHRPSRLRTGSLSIILYRPGPLNIRAPAISPLRLTLNDGTRPLSRSHHICAPRIEAAGGMSAATLLWHPGGISRRYSMPLIRDLTPKLSGRAQARVAGRVDDRGWHFIHVRSAPTNVRSQLAVRSVYATEGSIGIPARRGSVQGWKRAVITTATQ